VLGMAGWMSQSIASVEGRFTAYRLREVSKSLWLVSDYMAPNMCQRRWEFGKLTVPYLPALDLRLIWRLSKPLWPDPTTGGCAPLNLQGKCRTIRQPPEHNAAPAGPRPGKE
jgi:hypothetical protein